MVKFSVVIPLYNKEGTVERTLESVLSQKNVVFEIIVVNDGSTDRSQEKVLAIEDPRIRIINIQNSGVSFARNTGILNSQNEYIAFLDADDYWDENYLETLSDLIQNYPEAKVFYAGIKDGKDNGMDSSGYVSNYYSPEQKCKITSSSVVVNKECFNTAGYFNTKLTHGEDLDMWKRLVKTFRIAKSDRQLVQLNLSQNGSSSVLPGIEKKMDYYLNFNKIENKEEYEYWLIHVYGNMSLYWRAGRLGDLLKIMVKHHFHVIRMIKYKLKIK